MTKLYRLARFDWPLHFVLLLTAWLPDTLVFIRLRGALARPWFGRCGRDLRLGRGITFYNPRNIEIGDHVYIAFGNWFSAGAPIRIADEVLFGPRSSISSANHTLRDGSFRYGQPELAPIEIGRGSWIAANCTVVAGTRVGAGCLIAANSVAHGEIPDGVMFGGVPGRVIRPL